MAKKTEAFQSPCVPCGGNCCRYIAIGINPPRSKVAIGNIQWFLLHENVKVYIGHKKDWYVEFTTPCRAFKKGRCMEYKTRPKTCRDYGTSEGECEYYATPYAEKFETLEDFEKWQKAQAAKRALRTSKK